MISSSMCNHRLVHTEVDILNLTPIPLSQVTLDGQEFGKTSFEYMEFDLLSDIQYTLYHSGMYSSIGITFATANSYCKQDET